MRMEEDNAETEKIKSEITRKLFIRPVRHDCFRRLSKKEKRFIEEYAGFTGIEMRVFDLRCKGMSFDAIAAKLGYHPRYCYAIGRRIREQIAYLIQ